MDKYEYNLKLDQMKSRYAEEKYDEAADIADTINWNKVKNVNGLVKAGEVYEKVQRYEESREVLLMAYDRSPIGRMIIYRLAEVAVKMKDFQAAQDYYDEFVEIAPHDTLKYVLRYDIQKAQGASYEELIAIDDIGDTTAQCIRQYFDDPENQAIISELKDAGLTMEMMENNDAGDKLKGLTIVVTGTLPTLGRKEVADLIENNGGKCTGSVSKKTDYLVAGEAAGSKLIKAQALGIPVITEEELLKMLS